MELGEGLAIQDRCKFSHQRNMNSTHTYVKMLISKAASCQQTTKHFCIKTQDSRLLWSSASAPQISSLTVTAVITSLVPAAQGRPRPRPLYNVQKMLWCVDASSLTYTLCFSFCSELSPLLCVELCTKAQCCNMSFCPLEGSLWKTKLSCLLTSTLMWRGVSLYFFKTNKAKAENNNSKKKHPTSFGLLHFSLIGSRSYMFPGKSSPSVTFRCNVSLGCSDSRNDSFISAVLRCLRPRRSTHKHAVILRYLQTHWFKHESPW